MKPQLRRHSGSLIPQSGLLQELQARSNLGYTDPGGKALDIGSTQAVEVAVADIINRLYGLWVLSSFAAISAPTTSSFATCPTSGAVPVEQGRAAPTQGGAAYPGSGAAHQAQSHQVSGGYDQHSRPIVHPPQYVSPNQGLWEWTARVEFNKYQLGVGFSVPIFLGTVPEDPEEWLVSPNLVGAYHALVSGAPHRRNQGGVQEGFVHLNKAIPQHSGLGSLEPAVVEPYLTQQLDWRVQKVDGSVAELQSLEVTVVATPLTYSPGSQFPVPGEPRRYNRITFGHPGAAATPFTAIRRTENEALTIFLTL